MRLVKWGRERYPRFMSHDSSTVAAVTLEFEALAHANRTSLAWSGGFDAAEQLVTVGEGEDERSVRIPTATWSAFVEALLERLLPEHAPTATVAEATAPDVEVPPALLQRDGIGRVKPDAPTSPSRDVSPLTFFRCTASLKVDGTGRRFVLHGQRAMDLYTLAYELTAR